MKTLAAKLKMLRIECAFLSSGLTQHQRFESLKKFIRNDWEALQEGVNIRYFSFDNYTSSDDLSKIWNTMGQDISCTLYQRKLVCSIPEKKWAMKPLKIFTHGFGETMNGQKIVFLKGLTQPASYFVMTQGYFRVDGSVQWVIRCHPSGLEKSGPLDRGKILF